MATFDLDPEEISEVLGKEVLVTEFENETEQRRLKHDKDLVGFKLRSPVLNYTQFQDWRDFYLDHSGMLSTFDFTSPFDQVTYTCRFNSKMESSFKDGVYRTSFDFKIINQLE